MRESRVEERLCREVENIGGKCYKFAPHGQSGMPDRIVLHNSKAYFVEVKAPGKKPRALQSKVHRTLAKVGFDVWVIDTYEKITDFIETIK